MSETLEELKGMVADLSARIDAISREEEINPFVNSFLQQINNRMSMLEQRQDVADGEDQDTNTDQLPGVEDDIRTEEAACTTTTINDESSVLWTKYQPAEPYDIDVVVEVYWTGTCLRYVYDTMRYKGGKLHRVLYGVKGECQDMPIVGATDCVTLVDPECA